MFFAVWPAIWFFADLGFGCAFVGLHRTHTSFFSRRRQTSDCPGGEEESLPHSRKFTQLGVIILTINPVNCHPARHTRRFADVEHTQFLYSQAAHLCTRCVNFDIGLVGHTHVAHFVARALTIRPVERHRGRDYAGSPAALASTLSLLACNLYHTERPTRAHHVPLLVAGGHTPINLENQHGPCGLPRLQCCWLTHVFIRPSCPKLVHAPHLTYPRTPSRRNSHHQGAPYPTSLSGQQERTVPPAKGL